MKTPCEIVNKFFIPSIRAMIAKELTEKYRCTQMKIAEWLGVTQAAVSQYLSSKRATTERLLRSKPEVVKFVKEITAKLVNGEEEKVNISREFCRICKILKLKEDFSLMERYSMV
ncbi:MAG: transcriptional regulator [Candidatus Freyarchaeota archaeon]